MSREFIGGALDMDAYARLAQLHRPTDPAQLRAEVMRLHRSGPTGRDIATALRMAPDEVVNLLAEVAQ